MDVVTYVATYIINKLEIRLPDETVINRQILPVQLHT